MEKNLNEQSKLCPCRALEAIENVESLDLYNYENCCGKFHDANKEKIPKTAEELMRSRYSAFALQKVKYIADTTLTAQRDFLQIDEIEKWSSLTKWCGLEIINTSPKIGKNHAQVEFKAYFYDGDNKLAHHELSTFVKENNKWYFLDPTVNIKITMKQNCICNSGKKFKQCCGVFLK